MNRELEFANIYDVTGGHGSLSYLIVAQERSCVVDVGMGYSANTLLENIKKVLGDRPLTDIILTHSHYDHASGIATLKKEWPDVIVHGAAYAKHVFESERAWKVFYGMNMEAVKQYKAKLPEEFVFGSICVDHVVGDNDVIDLGDRKIKVFETPGHTRCSLTFCLDDRFLFTSETTGVVGRVRFTPNYLVSYKGAIEAFDKLSGLPVEYVLPPHSKIVEIRKWPSFFEDCRRGTVESREFVIRLHNEGKTPEEILKEHVNLYYTKEVQAEQPMEAFLVNQRSVISTVLAGK